ncbi:MAG: AmmeMemoRadiSam system protein A [Armatimonadota bacterium]
MRRTYTLAIIFSIISSAVFAASAFNEFQARRSPELARQASALARWAVECRLSGTEAKKPPMKLDPVFTRRSGMFVTINKKGRPRGCMGTIEPVQGSAAREIIVNAVGAATSDLRQRPLQPHELSQVTFCIAIMGPLKPVRGMDELAPDKLGLLVRSGSHSGILLPGEAKTASWQIKECKRKAGLSEKSPVQMFVFETVPLEDKRLPGAR